MTDLKYFKRAKSNDEITQNVVLQIKTEQIRANRAQPRAEFDNNSIIRLADSIRRYGILQPLTVRKAENEEIFTYELIAGERRLRAARLLGYLTVPCIVIEADEKMSAEMAIIENLLREDLNMFEQAYGFRQLIDNYGLTQEEVAKKMSLSQSAIANKLRLLKLSYEEQRLITETGLTERQARALLKVSEQSTRIDIIKHVAMLKLNVCTTEEYIENILKSLENATNNEKLDEIKPKSHQGKPYYDIIGAFERRIETFKKNGNDASICVLDNENEIDVHIKITKQASFG